jgi:hypothetical protein
MGECGRGVVLCTNFPRKWKLKGLCSFLFMYSLEIILIVLITLQILLNVNSSGELACIVDSS